MYSSSTTEAAAIELSTAMATKMRRTDLNGSWILDKTREPWSMKNYLQVMNVDPMAVEAHEKGEKEHDTIHTITMDQQRIKIVKRSRVNNDLVVELEFNKPLEVLLPPGNRPKRSLATTQGPAHVHIQNSMQTTNGLATVTDTKELVQEANQTFMVQTLFIQNEQTRQNSTTRRYFLPHQLDTTAKPAPGSAKK
mmetsp:Transcript_21844/g.51308  ORF Transcript_21844/g.51308 Transcript_21844/m.51308 type:complete len:194 (+) Transcript_21844:1-582(+)